MLNVALCLSIKSSGGVKKFDTVTPPQIATQQEKVFFGGGVYLLIVMFRWLLN